MSILRELAGARVGAPVRTADVDSILREHMGQVVPAIAPKAQNRSKSLKKAPIGAMEGRCEGSSLVSGGNMGIVERKS